MEKNGFLEEFGTMPIEKKRVKRARNNDVFELYEQNLPYHDDPFSEIYSFSSSDNLLNRPYTLLDDSIITSSQTDIFSEYYEIPDHGNSSYVDDETSRRNDSVELSSEERSSPIHEETTQSMDCDDVQYSQDLLNIREKLNGMIDDLKLLEDNQKTIFHYNDMKIINDTQNKLHSHLKELEDIQALLIDINSTQFLFPQDIELTWMLENQINLIQARINVLINEIKYINDPKYVENMAYLVISSQPFPKSVKQNKPLKEDIVISLISSSSYTCKPIGDVCAEVLSNINQKKSKNQSLIQNNTAKMISNKAIFNNILFPSGTRKKTISLKFHLEVEIYHPFTNKTHLVHIESEESKPIIVKTNENQWEEAEGILLKNETFKNQKSSSWFQFANSLQKRYLIATKQNLISPIRPLTIDDFNYIYKIKFNNSDIYLENQNYSNIQLHQFDAFWQWFGPGLHKIRYQRHLCSLWIKGYVCGYIPRSEAESILKDSSPGTFLIRLSERISGTFTVAYTVIENNVKRVYHYVVNSDDVFGAKKTLPDFLGNESTLTKLVKVSITNEYKKKYEIVLKDDVLGEFYSKRSTGMETDGYDRKIIRPIHS